MKPVHVGHPYCKIEFATERGNISISQTAMQTNDMDFDIYSVNTGRDVGGDDCATFSIVLVYKEAWYDNINGNDFVKISFGRGYEARPVLFGLVDTIQESLSYINLKPVRTITVSGRGFNKALMQFDVGIIQELDFLSGTLGFFRGQDNALSQKSSPAVIIKTAVDYYTNKGIDMTFANGKSWKDYIDTIYLDDGTNTSVGNPMSPYEYQGSLWDYIKEWRNAPFNETYWEVINGKPTFVVRPTPFNPDKWNMLNETTVNSEDIVDTNVGKNDLETYTVFSVKGTYMIEDLEKMQGVPIWYKPNYRKYGIRSLYVYSKYTTDESLIYKESDIGRKRYESPEKTETTKKDDTVKTTTYKGQQIELDNNDMQLLAPKEKQADQLKSMLGTINDTLSIGASVRGLEMPEHPAIKLSDEYVEDYVNQIVNGEELDVIQEVKQIEKSFGGGELGSVTSKSIDLFNWNIKNNEFESGSIMVKGHVKYKVGEKLKLDYNNMEYYIEKVSHNFVYNENWLTTIEVTRGIKPNKRFTSPWGEWSRITAADMAEISGMNPDIVKTVEQEVIAANNGKHQTDTPPANNTGTGKTGTLVKPVDSIVTSEYGMRTHPITGERKLHEGIDLRAPEGTPIKAAQGGKVSYAKWMNGYGNVIFIDHPDGTQTRYAHLSKIDVKVGQMVDIGAYIAKSGNTGKSKGAHLHFEVRENGVAKNPRNYINFP